MEIYVDNYGRRVFPNQPRIDQSEWLRDVTLASINGPPHKWGLYEHQVPPAVPFAQYMRKNAVIPSLATLPKGRRPLESGYRV